MKGPPPIPPLPPPPGLSSSEATRNQGATKSSKPSGLLEAIRGHGGVKGLKKVDPVSKNSGNFEDDLRARLAQRREAFGGGRDDLGTLSSLIPVDSDVKGEAEEGDDGSKIDKADSRKSSDIPKNITPQEKTTSGREEKKGNITVTESTTPLQTPTKISPLPKDPTEVRNPSLGDLADSQMPITSLSEDDASTQSPSRDELQDERKGAFIVASLRDIPVKTLLIIGKTGTGKSSLCNRISGQSFDSDVFPVSGEAVSCTQTTALGCINFNGDPEKLIGLIDTIGFDDPNNDTDIRIITELVGKLKNQCAYVNLFGIAVNGQSPRLDGSLVAMIRIFEEMFGEQFWKQCVLIFTRMPMDRKTKKKREKTSGKSDDDVASAYVKEVEKKFPNGAGLQYLFLDACYDDEDEDEEGAFKASMEDLYEMLTKAPKLQTFDVNEKVNSEHGKLKKRIEESEQLGQMLREFKRSVQKQRFIGLVNLTDADITFTSKRVLMERSQVVNAKSRVSIDWAYSNLGLFTSTGNPNVTVSWPPGNSMLLDAGQTLIIKAGGSFDVE